MSSENTNIIALLQANNELLIEIKNLLSKNRPQSEDIEESAKEHIIDFMLEHMNIPFVDNTIERSVYNALLDIVFKVIDKVI